VGIELLHPPTVVEHRRRAVKVCCGPILLKNSIEKTLAELSAEFGVHPTMISGWKQELVKRAGELFARGNKAPAVEDAQKYDGKIIDGLPITEARERPRHPPRCSADLRESTFVILALRSLKILESAKFG
jgi:hypothetical protein